MLTKFFILSAILLHQHISGETIVVGGKPNVNNLKPSITISRTTSLGSPASNIDLSLKVYQRPVDATSKETLKVLTGATRIDSTGRCIAYGISFRILGQLAIQNEQLTGNGGCDALWGSQCSQGILARLSQNLGKINDIACGVPSPDMLNDPPQGCPRSNTFAIGSFITGALLRNGSFMVDQASPTDPSVTWVYYQSDPSADGNYNELIKYPVFTYFVGRAYAGGAVDTGISCMAGKGAVSNTTSVNNGGMIVRMDIYALSMVLMVIFSAMVL